MLVWHQFPNVFHDSWIPVCAGCLLYLLHLVLTLCVVCLRSFCGMLGVLVVALVLNGCLLLYVT